MKNPVARVTSGALDAVAEPLRRAERTGRTVAKAARGARAGATRVDGRASRWTEHRAARREELIDAAVAAVNEFGSNVGMDQIAAAANTSKPVIYRYFADKDDLYRAVGERVTGRVVVTLQAAAAGDDPRALLHASIDAYLQLLDDNPELFRFVTQNRLLGTGGAGGTAGDGSTGSEFGGDVSAVLSHTLGAQLRSCGLDPDAAQPWADAVVGFIRAASLWWLNHPGAMTRVQLTDYLVALLWGGAAGVLQSAGRMVDGRPAPGVFAPLHP